MIWGHPVRGLTSDNHPHQQVKVQLKTKGDVEVDQALRHLLIQVNEYGLPTYESCQNYGEYLRGLGLDHVHESKRDYAYIEFYNFDDAMEFLSLVMGAAGIANPLHHQIAQEGTPGAWELKFRMGTNQFWVWFPAEVIPNIEGVLSA